VGSGIHAGIKVVRSTGGSYSTGDDAVVGVINVNSETWKGKEAAGVIHNEGAARGDTAVYSGGEKDDGQAGHMKGIGVCYDVSHHGDAEGPSSSDRNGF
jgi:hypothetical protein